MSCESPSSGCSRPAQIISIVSPGRRSVWRRRPSNGNPEDASRWTDLGAAYCAAGRWDEAIDALARWSPSNKDGDGLDWFLLATAHWRRGEKNEARRWYDQGLRWMKENARRLSGPDAEFLRGVRNDAEALLGHDGLAKDHTQEKNAAPPSKP